MAAKDFFSEDFDINIHGNQKITVVYTNKPRELERVLDMYQQWFAKGDPKIMGLDMEYTFSRLDKDKRMAVIQIAMRRHVLVYQTNRFELMLLYSVFFASSHLTD